jgi:hypothetical protein
MNGEIAIGGVFVPSLLLLATVALGATLLLIRLLTFAGFYRFVAYRALVDLCIYILVLGLLTILVPHFGIHL